MYKYRSITSQVYLNGPNKTQLCRNTRETAVSKNQHTINPMYDYFHITKVRSKGQGCFSMAKPEYQSGSKLQFQTLPTIYDKNIFQGFLRLVSFNLWEEKKL